MDEDFAFDIGCRTRDEWEERQREWEEISRQMDAESKERKRLGLPESTAGGDEDSSLGTDSYRVDDTADVPLGVRLFGLGCRLAELITSCETGQTARPHLPRLNNSSIN